MLRVTLTLAGLLALTAAGYVYREPAGLAARVLAGRSPHCSFTQALKTGINKRRQIDTNRDILKHSRLIEKDPAGFNLWQTPAGRFWVPNGSDYALHWDLAEQARNIYGENGRGVRAGDVVLDCGANVGTYVRTALQAGARLVVAIELAPENLECLRRNFVEEVRAGRVVIYPKGVWDKDDVLTLAVAPNNSAANTVVMHPEGAVNGPRVPLTTIDKLVAELGLERVDYIKMDIEGAEQNALRGARAALARHRPRMALSAYHRPDDAAAIPQLVQQGHSDYRMDCGPCSDTGKSLRPDVIYFYQ